MKRLLSFNCVVLLLICFVFLPVMSWADWQETLSGEFDHVETFDNLSDYVGSSSSGDTYTGSMPVTVTGTDTNWDYYSNYNTVNTSVNWIGTQDSGNAFSGSKAMVIDYGGSDGINGPSRFGYYIGEGDPSSGYTDVYSFYMIKIPRSFYPMSGDSFNYFGYLKTFEVASGFRDVWNWGSVTEQALTDGSDQVDHVYGLNFTMFNHQDCNYGTCSENTAGDDLSTLIHPVPAGDSYPYHYSAVYGSYGYEFRSATVGDNVRDGVWYGVEYRVRQSNPHGSGNGLVEVWIYDTDGNILGTQSHEVETFKDLTSPGYSASLSHGYNKFVIGGNRSGFDSASGGTFYIDDFIVNGSRIGPSYFAMLSGEEVESAPSTDVVEPPSNVVAE